MVGMRRLVGMRGCERERVDCGLWMDDDGVGGSAARLY